MLKPNIMAKLQSLKNLKFLPSQIFKPMNLNKFKIYQKIKDDTKLNTKMITLSFKN